MHSKFFKLSISFILCFAFIATPTLAKHPETTAQGVILIEPKTNTILYEKNAHAKFYPASITKIMKALIIAEEMPRQTVITKSSDSVRKVPSDSSSIGLQVGDQYTMLNGLYGLLLGSDNYIAYDFALSHSGSISKFADEMNTRATAYGALHTHFSNPHGYHDPQHYTTPYDMAQIAKVAFSNPLVAKIAGTATATFSLKNSARSIPLTNSSRLLKPETPYYNPHVVACKTGFHDDAQQTLVAKAVYDDIELIAVVMKTSTPNQYIDINHLFEYGHQNFSVEKINHTYQLVNHTMSDWAKPAITTAFNRGWIVSKGIDFREPITTGDLIGILKNIKPLQNKLRAQDITTATHTDLSNTVTRKNMAQIITYLNQKLALVQSTGAPSISLTDLNNLSLSDQKAIAFVTSHQLMSPNSNGTFNPNESVTWQDALCVLYKYFYLK